MVYKSYWGNLNDGYGYRYSPSDSNNYLCNLNGQARKGWYCVGRKVVIIESINRNRLISYIRFLYTKENGI